MSRKAKLVISDTHIGAGARDQGNKLEDFISDAEFAAWLQTLVKESDRDEIEMELIINGDWIEFLQTPAVRRFSPRRRYETKYYTDAAESEALKRLEIVYKGHFSIFQALADFLHLDPPRRSLTILFGNHDPEVVYPAVQKRLRQMIGATGAKAALVDIGERVYFRDGVYAEHGNAYVEEVNRFTDPDSPLDPDDPWQIERPPGSHFVTRFFNQVEWERPWVDGVHPLTSLLFYALAYEPAFALRILRVFLTTMPDIVLGLAGTPATAEGASASERVLAELAGPGQEEALAARLRASTDYAAQFQRSVEQALVEKGAIPAPPPDVAAAPAVAKPPEQRAQDFTEIYWKMLEEEAARIARDTGAKVVLFGHIHERVEKPLPGGGVYLNTGAWIWKGDFEKAGEQTWQDLIRHPEKYEEERDLTYARIDYDEEGRIVGAWLGRVGPAPGPLPDPGPQPEPSLWAKILLGIKHLWERLF